MQFKSKFMTCLAVASATVVFGVAAMAMADENASSGIAQATPDNLVPAETIDAQIQAEVQAYQEQADVAQDDNAAVGEEALARPFRPVFRPVPIPRPGYRPIPRPYPVPVPLPIPYPGARLITCYAQSTLTGVSYYGTAYYAATAQAEALNTCVRVTGAACVQTGCN